MKSDDSSDDSTDTQRTEMEKTSSESEDEHFLPIFFNRKDWKYSFGPMSFYRYFFIINTCGRVKYFCPIPRAEDPRTILEIKIKMDNLDGTEPGITAPPTQYNWYDLNCRLWHYVKESSS